MQIISKKGSHWASLLAVFAVGLILMFGSSLDANDTFQSTCTATVLTALAITETQDLDWGNVYMGVAKAIDSATDDLGAGAGGSGLWAVAGSAGDNIQVALLLPEYLWSTTVKQRIDVFFQDTDASYCPTGVTNTDFSLGTYTAKNPYAIGSLTLTEATGNIGLGGTVIPSSTQLSAADYTATIILTVWFEGA
ncbi:MAG: hypothetical protein ABII79_14210 [bacterium]